MKDNELFDVVQKFNSQLPEKQGGIKDFARSPLIRRVLAIGFGLLGALAGGLLVYKKRSQIQKFAKDRFSKAA